MQRRQRRASMSMLPRQWAYRTLSARRARRRPIQRRRERQTLGSTRTRQTLAPRRARRMLAPRLACRTLVPRLACRWRAWPPPHRRPAPTSALRRRRPAQGRSQSPPGRPRVFHPPWSHPPPRHWGLQAWRQRRARRPSLAGSHRQQASSPRRASTRPSCRTMTTRWRRQAWPWPRQQAWQRRRRRRRPSLAGRRRRHRTLLWPPQAWPPRSRACQRAWPPWRQRGSCQMRRPRPSSVGRPPLQPLALRRAPPQLSTRENRRAWPPCPPVCPCQRHRPRPSSAGRPPRLPCPSP
mmetsp:Transcript_1857/g.5320  ORF Transcript_1857/g.5320 Transcript_1857/m.5320 type:complete len:294 (-) Transcript_1857:333-1214(-)